MDSLTYFLGSVKTRKFSVNGAVVVLNDLNFASSTLRISDCLHTENFNRDTSVLSACFLSELNFRKFQELYTPTEDESLLIEFVEEIFKNQEEFFLVIFKQSETQDYKRTMLHEISHLFYKYDPRFKRLADIMVNSNSHNFKEAIYTDLKERGYVDTEISDETCANMMEGEFPPPADKLKLHSKLRRFIKSVVRETFPSPDEISDQRNLSNCA